AVLRLAGRPERATGPAAARRTGWAALVAGALLPVSPVPAAAPLAWALAGPMLAARRAAARHEAAVVDQLPDIVDLLALTAAAGLPVPAALVAIGDRPGGPLGAACARAAAVVRRGGTTAGALAEVAAAGPAVRPLVDALAQHVRYGTPLVPALDRVGIEARARRRRRAEEAARRLPVALLFPLVLTTFPAFVLLTVVPLLAGSFGSLSLTPVCARPRRATRRHPCPDRSTDPPSGCAPAPSSGPSPAGSPSAPTGVRPPPSTAWSSSPPAASPSAS